MTGMKRTTEKNLMVFSGRAHPELAEEVADLLGTDAGPAVGLRVRQLRDLRPLRGVGPRAATPSCSRATPRRSTSGSWST